MYPTPCTFVPYTAYSVHNYKHTFAKYTLQHTPNKSITYLAIHDIICPTNTPSPQHSQHTRNIHPTTLSVICPAFTFRCRVTCFGNVWSSQTSRHMCHISHSLFASLIMRKYQNSLKSYVNRFLKVMTYANLQKEVQCSAYVCVATDQV